MIICEDGDVVDVGERLEIVERVQAGMTFVDGLGIGDVGGEVLRDRRKLAGDGVVVVVVTVDSQTGELVSGPDIVNRGFVYEETSQGILDEARERVVDAIAESSDAKVIDPSALQQDIRRVLGPLLQRGHAAQTGDPAGRDGGLRSGCSVLAATRHAQLAAMATKTSPSRDAPRRARASASRKASSQQSGRPRRRRSRQPRSRRLPREAAHAPSTRQILSPLARDAVGIALVVLAGLAVLSVWFDAGRARRARR